MIQIDMDIPKTCDDCPFHIYHSGKNYVCVATPLFYPMNLANYKDGRKDFCPLIEVPQESILNKIRAEIKALSPEPTAYDVVDGNPIKDAIWETLADVLQVIDKYAEDLTEKLGEVVIEDE